MQFGNALNVSLVNEFINKYYPIDENVWGNEQFDNINSLLTGFSSRLAGIYYNPNVMGLSILILYLIIVNGFRKFYSSRITFLFFLMTITSILLTGSRTAMITFIIINYFIFRKYIDKWLIYIVPILCVLIFVLINKSSLFEFRSFSNLTGIFSDQGESGYIKINIFLSYFRDFRIENIFDFFKLFFGSLNWDRQFDADLGYIISFFGIIGFILIASFFYHVYSFTEKSYRYVFFLFLISIGATVLINYRYSILLFLIFSVGYKKNTPLNNEKSTLARTSNLSK